ncbi:unnamed protein product [Protopolystoma xenopodis]|uniref:Uncharacterized protein n=1 Tax=Protopolystoma xenopodis TaxID=117903 RepID=A0A3S5B2N3_9PLAT|nr:unnamed protein product [Protopolystoma xenopodis]
MCLGITSVYHHPAHDASLFKIPHPVLFVYHLRLLGKRDDSVAADFLSQKPLSKRLSDRARLGTHEPYQRPTLRRTLVMAESSEAGEFSRPLGRAPQRRSVRPSRTLRDSAKWTYYSLADVDEDAAGADAVIARNLMAELAQRKTDSTSDSATSSESAYSIK